MLFAAAGLTAFVMVVVGFLLLALPDAPESEAGLHEALAPLPGSDTAAAASQHGYLESLLALIACVWAVKVARDAYHAYRYPELERR